MERQLSQLREFQSKIGLVPPEKPTLDVPDNLKFGLIKLAGQELNEVIDSAEKNDIVGVSKELADSLYFLYAAVNAFGFQDIMVDIFDEVHKSNMSKFDKQGNNGYLIGENGKVIKEKAQDFHKADLNRFFN